MNKKIALIPIMIVVSISLYFIIITGYGYYLNQEMQKNIMEIEEVKEFTKTYGSMTVQTRGIGFWFEKIGYTHIDYQKDSGVTLSVFPQMNDRLVLECFEIIDAENRSYFKKIENPTVEEIRQSKNYCN